MVPELRLHSGDLDFHRGDFGFDVDKIILRSKDEILELFMYSAGAMPAFRGSFPRVLDANLTAETNFRFEDFKT